MKKYFACLALFAAVMYVGCSDYLDEFKDEYEDQFAQKVDEPKDDERSSDSHDPVMSSGIENKNSSDSKDLKSSDSQNPQSGSSSSVTGEDAANRCSGTVIYDVSVNPSQTVFGSHFKYAGRGEGYVPADENGLNMELAPGIFATLVFDETRDVSSWKGICIEYTAGSTTDLSFTNSNKNGQVAAFFKISPSSKLQKYEAKWENANKVGDFDFKAVSTINFGDNGANLVVSRITTIADVDLSSNSSKVCDGTVLYSTETGDVGSGFFLRKDDPNDGLGVSSSTGVLFHINGDEGPWLWFNGNTENYTGYDISNWGGLCVEYSSDQNFSLRVQSLHEESPSKYQYASVALDSGLHRTKKFVWDSWNSSSDKNTVIKSANSLNFYGEKDLQGIIEIERITTINKVKNLFSRNCIEGDTTCFYWNGNKSVNMKDCHPDSAWAVLIPSDSESRLLTKAGDTLGGKIGSQIIPNSAFVGCDGICGTFIPKNGTYVQVSLSHAFAADLTKEDGICMSYLSSADHTVFILSKETSQGYSKMSGNLEKATSVKMVNVKWSDLSKDFFPEVTFENFFEGDVIISVNLQGNFQENVKFNIFEIGSYGTCKGVYEVPD